MALTFFMWATLGLLFFLGLLIIPVLLGWKSWINEVRSRFAGAGWVWIVIKGKDSKHIEYFRKSKEGIVKIKDESYILGEEAVRGEKDAKETEIEGRPVYYKPSEVFIKGKHAVYEFNEGDAFPHSFKEKQKEWDAGIVNNLIIRARTLAKTKGIAIEMMLIMLILGGVAITTYLVFTQGDKLAEILQAILNVQTTCQTTISSFTGTINSTVLKPI